ncbi:MAG TPA: response regulator transcription factor [Ramlibacter sp.]|nr:response regulator transcription factor [Ramlibacter sp.]
MPASNDSTFARAIRVGIVDDHSMVVTGLRLYFSKFPDLQVVGIAFDGYQAVLLLQQEEVDVLLLDLSMPGRSGLDVLREIKRASPDTKVVVLTGDPTAKYELQCRQLGAQAYLTKTTEPLAIVQAIRAAAGRHSH